MLTAEDRRNRLEALLARVRRNRGYLDEARRDIRGVAPTPLETDADEELEPIAVKSYSIDSIDAIPTLVSEPPEPITARVSFEDLSAVTAGGALADYLEPEPLDVASAETDDVGHEESLFQRTTYAPVEEPVEESVAESSDGAGMAEAPEPPRQIAEPVAKAAVLTVEAELEASSKMLTVKGRPPSDWSLGAVLERAWKLGVKE